MGLVVGPAGRTSWKDQLEGPAGRSSWIIMAYNLPHPPKMIMCIESTIFDFNNAHDKKMSNFGTYIKIGPNVIA